MDKINKNICLVIPPIINKKWARSDALATAQKKYYMKNKEKLTADQIKYNKNYVKKEFSCICGCTLQMNGKYLHMRSKRHKRRMEKIKNGENPDICESNLKYSCECGSKILNRNKKIHEKSDKHINYLDNKKNDLKKIV